jgi:hypothetical protein
MAILWVLVFLVPVVAAGQGRGRGGAPPTPVEPPRNADGRVELGPPEGQTGLWVGQGGLSVTSHESVPYQPWAGELVEYRRSSMRVPHTRCKPSGGPRQWLTPYGAEMVEIPDLQRIFIFDIGGPHTYRTIFMDADTHPEDLEPSYYGHSIGRWEGDTLVIDSVGYGERFWVDRGQTPHTEDLHMVERLTRTSLTNMDYEITIEDPNVYTEPWTASLNVRWLADRELFEYICQDNNRAVEIMIGLEADVNRSWIVP